MLISVVIVLAVIADYSKCQQPPTGGGPHPPGPHPAGPGYNDSMRLRHDLLLGYDSRERPVLDLMKHVIIHVAFDIAAIEDVDEVGGKFMVGGVLSNRWHDEKLMWNPAMYGNIQALLFRLADIWYPYLLLKGSYKGLSYTDDRWMKVRANHAGDIVYQPASMFQTTCNIDVTYYPYDTQVCSLIFVSHGHTGVEMSLHPDEDILSQNHFSDINGEWSLIATDAYRIPGTLYFPDEVVFQYTLKRKPLFVIVNVLLPILLMSLINILVFVLPIESGERITFAITILLALAVFLTLVSENLPKTSEPISYLSYYLMGMMVHSILMTIATIFTLRLYYKKESVPTACARITETILSCRVRPTDRKDRNKVIPIRVVDVKQMSADHDVVEDDDVVIVYVPVITWHDVSAAADRTCLLAFLISFTVTNGIYVYIIFNNT